MKGLKGSFLGFTYNNIHSSVVGITRAQNGQMEDKIVPQIKDLVAERQGVDGSYYFGSIYPKREFVINFAFEAMTKEQLRLIKNFWKDGNFHALIFDEAPYKVYYARITGNRTFSFLEHETEEGSVQGGEGSFVFTCYYPYAKSSYEYVEDYTTDRVLFWAADDEIGWYNENELKDSNIKDPSILDWYGGATNESLAGIGSVVFDLLSKDENLSGAEGVETINGMLEMSDEDYAAFVGDLEINSDISNIFLYDGGSFVNGSTGSLVFSPENSEYNNKSEWIAGSKIPKRSDNYGTYSDYRYLLYNAGDLDMPFKIVFPAPNENESIEKIYIECKEFKLYFGPVINTINKGTRLKDDYLIIDSARNTIEGYTSKGIQTGNLYNYTVTEGDFFLIPPGENHLKVYGENKEGRKILPIDIEFHYVYF